MPRNPSRGVSQMQVELAPDLIESVRELARGNGRTLRAEVEHALRRHLEAPPLASISTPALPPAAAEPEGVAETRRRRRGR